MKKAAKFEVGKAIADASEGRIVLEVQDGIAVLKGDFTRKERKPLRFKKGAGWRYAVVDGVETWKLNIRSLAEADAVNTLAESAAEPKRESAKKPSGKTAKKPSAKSAGKTSAKSDGQPSRKKTLKPAELEGATVAFTGRMFRIVRKDVEKIARSKGLKVAHGLTRGTQFLVKGGFAHDKELVETAKAKGVRIVEENEFLNALYAL